MPPDSPRSDAPRDGVAWRDQAGFAALCVVIGGLVAWQISVTAALAALAVCGFGLAASRRKWAHELVQELASARELQDERAVVMAQLRASEQRYRQLSGELERRVESRTAALEAVNAELAAFNYSVSHDLRAPLRHIAGFVRILEVEYGTQLPEAGRGYLDRVAAGSRRMGLLIDALLALSRVGRVELRPAAIDLSALARVSCEEMQPTDRPVELVLGALPTVTGDPALLRQLFDNLLGNAIKFTAGQAAPRIEVGVRRDGGEAVFYVRDNGVGFDVAHVDRLFRVFSRLHGEAEFEGTGIGLSIVKRIVERHGGRAWAEAEEGRGATFFFTLGVVESAEQEPA